MLSVLVWPKVMRLSVFYCSEIKGFARIYTSGYINKYHIIIFRQQSEAGNFCNEYSDERKQILGRKNTFNKRCVAFAVVHILSRKLLQHFIKDQISF